MGKKLELIVNNGQSGAIPPPPMRKPIRVRDSKSAKRLLGRLIVQMQRGEVLSEAAKDMTYLINTFISLMKYSAEEKEIFEYMSRQFSVQLHELHIFMDNYFKEIEMFIPPDKLLSYQKKYDVMSTKFNEERKIRQKNILKEIASRTSFKPKRQADQSPEEMKALVMNYLRSFPREILYQTIQEIQNEYFHY